MRKIWGCTIVVLFVLIIFNINVFDENVSKCDISMLENFRQGNYMYIIENLVNYLEGVY